MDLIVLTIGIIGHLVGFVPLITDSHIMAFMIRSGEVMDIKVFIIIIFGEMDILLTVGTITIPMIIFLLIKISMEEKLLTTEVLQIKDLLIDFQEA